MPKYYYQAIDVKGRKVEGEVVAASRQQVIEDLAKIQYSVLKLEEATVISAETILAAIPTRAISLRTLAIFTRQFATLMSAGVPLLRSLDSLKANSTDNHLSKILEGVREDINSGHSLSRALGRRGGAFPGIYIALVKAGEVTGAIGEIFERLAKYLEKEYSLRKKVEAATAYPLVVFIACVALTVFVVNYVFPTFVGLFEGLSIRLPWPTRALIAITHLAHDWSIVVPAVGLLAFGFVVFKAFVATPIGKRQFHGLLLALPYLGPLYQKIAIARMCNTLSTMLDSGIPMLAAISATAQAIENVVISDKVHDIGQALKGGASLSGPLEEQRGFPPMLIHMVKAGEQSGHLPLMLRKMAEFLEDEIEYYIQFLVTLLEPLMVLMMGGVVLFILLGVFLPVYQLVKQF